MLILDQLTLKTHNNKKEKQKISFKLKPTHENFHSLPEHHRNLRGRCLSSQTFSSQGWDCSQYDEFRIMDQDIRFEKCTFKYSDRLDSSKKATCKTLSTDTECVAGGCQWNYFPKLDKAKKTCKDSAYRTFVLKSSGKFTVNMNSDMLAMCTSLCYK